MVRCVSVPIKSRHFKIKFIKIIECLDEVNEFCRILLKFKKVLNRKLMFSSFDDCENIENEENVE